MKEKKVYFNELFKVLSQDQMKKIMGGNGDEDEEVDEGDTAVICIYCSSDSECRTGRICRTSSSCLQGMRKVCARPYWV